MFEYTDAAGNRNAVRSGKTLGGLIRSRRIVASTPFKNAGEAEFVPARKHPETAALCAGVPEPGPVAAEVGAEMARRHEVLAAAVVHMKPVIDLLYGCKTDGCDVGLELTPPACGSSDVTGTLRCAPLGRGEDGGTETYELTVQGNGGLLVKSMTDQDPDERDAPEPDGPSSYSASGLADAIRKAEVAAALRRAAGPERFVI